MEAKGKDAQGPPGGCRAGPIPLHHPSNCPPPSLFLYIANSSPAVGRLLSAPHGRSGATASPFRRNGITVPAQRGGRSGATASPFRRNGITVPAQRHRRSGETGCPFRRDRMPVPILDTINKLRGTTKASLTFRHSLRAPPPKVGTAVPCGPPPLQPNGKGGSPLPPVANQPMVGAAVLCGPPPLQPNGKGGSPLPPVANQPMVGAAVLCGPPRLHPMVGAAVPCRPSRLSDREAVYQKAVRPYS